MDTIFCSWGERNIFFPGSTKNSHILLSKQTIKSIVMFITHYYSNRHITISLIACCFHVFASCMSSKKKKKKSPQQICNYFLNRTILWLQSRYNFFFLKKIYFSSGLFICGAQMLTCSLPTGIKSHRDKHSSLLYSGKNIDWFFLIFFFPS